uniref:Uncharacterized protein n=1 Tax=Chondria sp. (in: red algae) TaxID=1982705 RepID=A0A1Z1MDL9_9FLOR|nr:hypothetical protein [Chondria sp. (in: red algae)]
MLFIIIHYLLTKFLNKKVIGKISDFFSLVSSIIKYLIRVSFIN